MTFGIKIGGWVDNDPAMPRKPGAMRMAEDTLTNLMAVRPSATILKMKTYTSLDAVSVPGSVGKVTVEVLREVKPPEKLNLKKIKVMSPKKVSSK